MGCRFLVLGLGRRLREKAVDHPQRHDAKTTPAGGHGESNFNTVANGSRLSCRTAPRQAPRQLRLEKSWLAHKRNSFQDRAVPLLCPFLWVTRSQRTVAAFVGRFRCCPTAGGGKSGPAVR